MFKSDIGFARIVVIFVLVAIVAFAIWWARNPIQEQVVAPQENAIEDKSLDTEVESIDLEFEDNSLEDIDKDINSL